MRDGHLNKCKICSRIDTKERTKFLIENDPKWVEREIIRQREKEARYRKEKRPKNKENVKQGKKRWEQRNAQKKYANTIVSNAKRDGRLLKQVCEKCGDLKAEAHHDDYSKPLEVRWLCIKHHNEHHNLKRAEFRRLKNQNKEKLVCENN